MKKLAEKTARIRQALGTLILAIGGLLLLNQLAQDFALANPASQESRYGQESTPEPESSAPVETDLA